MNKIIAIIFVVLMLAAVSVSAFNYYENYTLNTSMVNYFDDFNRSDGNATGSSMTYGSATWLFGGEIFSEAMQLDDNYTNYGVSIMGPDIYYNSTQVLEFDWNRVEFLNYNSTLEFDLGNNFGSPTIYFQLYFLHESNGTDGSLVCDTNTTTYYENTWYHMKIMIDKDNHLISVYNDGTPVCENISYTESAGDTDFWAVFGSTGAYESVAQFDNIVNYNGTQNPYYLPCIPDYVCIGYGDCVAGNQSCTGVWDQNDCMVPYTGNYSEFTPQTCDPDQYTCFQQFANVSTCGGQSTGSYSVNNALFDGDWSSYMVASAFQFGLYPRPENATTNSFIMFRYGAGVWQNFSIPGECWIPNFKFGPSYYGGTGSYFCWDSGGMNRQFSGGWATSNDTFYEQGVFWDICNPNWNCTGYDSCLENNTQLCNNVTDLNTCDLSYSGDYSEFVPQVCDFCTPNWNCSLFDNCTANVSECLAVNDLNVCNESFTGNLSDYDESCVTPPPITGYVPAYGSGDLAGLTIDTMAQAVLEVIALLGVIVAVVVVVYAAGKIKKIGR